MGIVPHGGEVRAAGEGGRQLVTLPPQLGNTERGIRLLFSRSRATAYGTLPSTVRGIFPLEAPLETCPEVGFHGD